VVPGLTWTSFFLDNLLPVTIGNVIGGVFFVASAYWYVHLKAESCTPS
jgi:formate transporter